MMRGGAVAARRAHNPEVLGSNPSPATEKRRLRRNLTNAESVVKRNPSNLRTDFRLSRLG
jgi:hypothetical protein